MEKSDIASVSGTVTIASGASNGQVWCADEAAATLVTFGAGGDWIVKFKTDANWGAKCMVEIGYCTAAGGASSFTAFPLVGAFQGSTGSYVLSWQFNANSVGVAKGDYLAVKITNLSGSSHTVECCSGCSFLDGPCTDPGYPVPEMATSVLLGAGILGLVGYAYVGHRRQKTA